MDRAIVGTRACNEPRGSPCVSNGFARHGFEEQQTSCKFVGLLLWAYTAATVSASTGSSRAALTGRQQPHRRPPAFRSGVDLVTIDLWVSDAASRPVPGLQLDQFTIQVDGAPRTPVSLQWIDSAAAPATFLAGFAPASPAAADSVRRRSRRGIARRRGGRAARLSPRGGRAATSCCRSSPMVSSNAWRTSADSP